MSELRQVYKLTKGDGTSLNAPPELAVQYVVGYVTWPMDELLPLRGWPYLSTLREQWKPGLKLFRCRGWVVGENEDHELLCDWIEPLEDLTPPA